MRWSIVALLMLGVFAAAAAAVLVGVLRADRVGEADPAAAPVKVLVAAQPLRAVSVVDRQGIEVREVERAKLPPDALTDPVEVVGKVLVVPMVEGQPFKKEYFAGGRSKVNLAAALPDGMRAVSLALSSHQAMNGLVYPGCVVDVLASLRLPSEVVGQRGELVSVTLLRSVQVLAVESTTVASDSEAEKKDKSPVRSFEKHMVTLLVKPKQAELLQIAQQHGTLSLTMRNPMDGDVEASGYTLLSEVLHSREDATAPEGADDAHVVLAAEEAPAAPLAAAPLGPAAAPVEAPVAADAQAPPPEAGPRTWEIEFLRGGVSATQTLHLREQEDQ